MSVQTSYRYSTRVNVAGGIADLAPYAIDTFLNEEDTGKLLPGVGVVHGTKAGKTIKKPTAESTADKFLGIATNNHTLEYDLEGKLSIPKNKAIGVMTYGRIYARVKTGVTVAPGDAVYLVKAGDEAGFFSNASGDGVKIAARFLSAVDASAGIAEIELFNAPQPAGA